MIFNGWNRFRFNFSSAISYIYKNVNLHRYPQFIFNIILKTYQFVKKYAPWNILRMYIQSNLNLSQINLNLNQSKNT